MNSHFFRRPRRDDGSGPLRRRGGAALAGALALAALATSSVATAGSGPGQGNLGKVRGATAQFHRVDKAIDAGHLLGSGRTDIPITGCVANPEKGAMGYHYFDRDAIEDTVLDPLHPEGLVYEPLPNGKLHLVAVEWIVPADLWHDAGNVDPPTVLGQEMGILNPALDWYILHAWVWKPNPAGMFENWNPDVVCP